MPNNTSAGPKRRKALIVSRRAVAVYNHIAILDDSSPIAKIFIGGTKKNLISEQVNTYNRKRRRRSAGPKAEESKILTFLEAWLSSCTNYPSPHRIPLTPDDVRTTTCFLPGLPPTS